MKAKDTLMTFKEQTEEMKTAKVKPGCLVRKQAEISFKAGIKEVFDFFHDNSAGIMMNEHALEAKLKDWGLEEEKDETVR